MVYDDRVPPINEGRVRALMAPSQRFVLRPRRALLRDHVHRPIRHRLHRYSMDLAGWLVCFGVQRLIFRGELGLTSVFNAANR